MEIYESIDSEMLTAYFFKQTIDKIFKTKKITNSILSVEVAYKNLIASVLTAQHTLKKDLPDSLIYLPLYILGYMKHRACCRDELQLKLDVDTTNYIRIKLQKLGVNEILSFIYPKIYQLHNILSDKSIGQLDDNGFVILPEVFRI